MSHCPGSRSVCQQRMCRLGCGRIVDRQSHHHAASTSSFMKAVAGTALHSISMMCLMTHSENAIEPIILLYLHKHTRLVQYCNATTSCLWTAEHEACPSIVGCLGLVFNTLDDVDVVYRIVARQQLACSMIGLSRQYMLYINRMLNGRACDQLVGKGCWMPCKWMQRLHAVDVRKRTTVGHSLR